MNDAAQSRRSIGPPILEPLGLGLHVLQGDAQGRFAAEWRLAGEHLIAGDAERIDVASRIERFALDLLGAHVQRRAHRHAGLREIERVPFAADAGQPEIGHLHLARPSEHDVLGFDVAMNYPLIGRLGQCGRRLPHDRDDELHVGRAATQQQLAKILPRDVLLGDIMHAIDAADLVNLHDVGVYEGRGGLGLHVKPAHVGGVLCQLALQNLKRDLPPQRNLLGQIHFGHRPAPQSAQQAIIADLPAGKIEIEIR